MQEAYRIGSVPVLIEDEFGDILGLGQDAHIFIQKGIGFCELLCYSLRTKSIGYQHARQSQRRSFRT
jgi:hypothetical protein